jgi:hypothetical protein
MPFRVVVPGGGRHSFRSVYWPARATFSIIREMAVYLRHVLSFARRCDGKTAYGNIPEHWRVSFADFSRRHDLVYIPQWLELPVVSFGYGNLEEIETWFVFNYITAVNFLGIAFFLILAGLPPVRRLDQGYGDLVTRMGTHLDVRTRHEVVGIDRSNGVRVFVKRAGETRPLPFDFDALVLSVPLPLLKGVVDFSETEQFLTRQIHLSPYTIVACEIKGVDDQCLLVRHRAHARGLMDGFFDGIRKKERLTVLKNLWYYYSKSRSLERSTTPQLKPPGG